MITAIVHDAATKAIKYKISGELDYIKACLKQDEAYTVLYDTDDIEAKPDMDLVSADINNIQLDVVGVSYVVR